MLWRSGHRAGQRHHPPQARARFLDPDHGRLLPVEYQSGGVVLLRDPAPPADPRSLFRRHHFVLPCRSVIAAVAWRPDILKKEGRIHLSLLNFFMLLGWWIFLYAFLVFPYQYVHLNVDAYNAYYDGLYLVQNALLLTILGLAALTSTGAWRRLYLHFFGANLIYAFGSQLLDRAIISGTYYSGSLYDLPFIVPILWVAAASLSARTWGLKNAEIKLNRSWTKLVPRLAMLAILSLPMLGLWTLFLDRSRALLARFPVDRRAGGDARARSFRILAPVHPGSEAHVAPARIPHLLRGTEATAGPARSKRETRVPRQSRLRSRSGDRPAVERHHELFRAALVASQISPRNRTSSCARL